MFFNQKSILLATATAQLFLGIAFGFYNKAQAQSDSQEVTINFEGWVGDEEFVCGESYEDVGTAESTVTPTDFRFYVSDLAMVDSEGNFVPVELEQDGKWQYKNVALLDFEDGSSVCDNGTAETRTTVVGTVPAGDYENLQFTLGVPKDLNHEDAAIAPSPLNLTSMWWNWQGGYKFLRVDMETEEAIASVASIDHSLTTHSQDGEGNVQINQQSTTTRNHGGSQTTTQSSRQASIFKNGQGTHNSTSSTHTSSKDDLGGINHGGNSNGYLIHLGSTGCQDSAQSSLFGCANPNRVNVVLEDFNPEDDVVIADLAELLYDSNLSENAANTPNGCMSSPEDGDCNPIMENLGISTTSSAQNFFFVE